MLRSHALLLSAAIAALSATGCTASSKFMHELPPGATPQPAADQATVIFVRHSSLGAAIRTTIVDEHGDFVGDSLAHGAFARRFPPGRHMFVVWAENTDVLQADLAPGKMYYVEVDPAMGAFSARMHLFAIKPSSESWKDLKEWLADSKWFDVDVEGGRGSLRERADDVKERLSRANEHLKEYSGEDLEKRTLKPTDGT